MFPGIQSRRLFAVVAMILCLWLGARACSSDGEPAVVDDGFLAITDCRELERLASVEVDRISSTNSADVAAAATARFERIVDHRDTVCN